MIERFINSFKDKDQVIGENIKIKKNKKDVETELSKTMQLVDELKDEVLDLRRAKDTQEDWHDKYKEQKKLNGEKLELILSKVDEIFNEVKKTKRVNKKLSKENEELLAKQLGE